MMKTPNKNKCISAKAMAATCKSHVSEPLVMDYTLGEMTALQKKSDFCDRSNHVTREIKGGGQYFTFSTTSYEVIKTEILNKLVIAAPDGYRTN